MRIGDWKLIGDETLSIFQLYNVQKDAQETRDLSQKMPEKTEEMKNILVNLWHEIEAEGPREWWERDGQRPKKGSTLSY